MTQPFDDTGVFTESTSAYTWERGAYLVSGGLAVSVICCQLFRIPHASLVSSLLGKKKPRYIVCDTYYIILNTYLHGKTQIAPA